MSLKKLNKIQKAAVEANDGPILIFAGAGSGKTRVLTHKMYFLINKGLYKPENILSVTFTNKAADEMKQRVISTLEMISNGKKTDVKTYLKKWAQKLK